MMMFLILTFFIAGQALAQNVLIVEGHPPIELQSMTAAQIAEMEKAQREQERANTIPAPVLREPVVQGQRPDAETSRPDLRAGRSDPAGR